MSTLAQMVQQNINKTVYAWTKGISTRHQPQSNQWWQWQKAPNIEVRKWMRISGYNDWSDFNPWPWITASWKKVSPEWVAVSDRSIPMWSTVYVDWKKYEVTDKTNKRIWKELWDTIDIWSNEPTQTIIKRWVSKGDVQIIKKQK